MRRPFDLSGGCSIASNSARHVCGFYGSSGTVTITGSTVLAIRAELRRGHLRQCQLFGDGRQHAPDDLAGTGWCCRKRRAGGDRRDSLASATVTVSGMSRYRSRDRSRLSSTYGEIEGLTISELGHYGGGIVNRWHAGDQRLQSASSNHADSTGSRRHIGGAVTITGSTLTDNTAMKRGAFTLRRYADDHRRHAPGQRRDLRWRHTLRASPIEVSAAM